MLKLSHKKKQNTEIKNDGKSMHRNSLIEANMTNMFLTQSAWTLVGSPCFNFSFELR